MSDYRIHVFTKVYRKQEVCPYRESLNWSVKPLTHIVYSLGSLIASYDVKPWLHMLNLLNIEKVNEKVMSASKALDEIYLFYRGKN